jgi:hypothetical protein
MKANSTTANHEQQQMYCIADSNVLLSKYMMLSCSKKSKCCEKHKKGKRCKKCPNR